MATRKQQEAARRNIKKAQKAAREKKTIAHLPNKVRSALGTEGAKAARRGARPAIHFTKGRDLSSTSGQSSWVFPADRRWGRAS
jgi:hypothetical protein